MNSLNSRALTRQARAELRRHLEWAEGREKKPYLCPADKITIGVGRNLQDKGLSDLEVDLLLDNDITDVLSVCVDLPYWNHLNDARRIVVADMMFNLGERGFHTFKRFEDALLHEVYDEAAHEMVDSEWYRQTGRRAKKLVKAMRTGTWQSSLH